MADVTINDLTAKTTPVSTDEVEIQETGGGTSKKATLANLAKGMSLDNIAAGSSNVHFTTSDETKLDGIETAATADQTGAEIKTAYEAEADTNAYTDAEKTKLAGIETGADVTDATNVDAAGAVMESDLINTTAGVGDAGKPIKLNASGVIDSTMYTDSDTTDHTALSNIGTNTHAQIDTHISNTSNPHTVTAAQVGNSTAQWNADQIQGVAVDATELASPSDGDILVYRTAGADFVLEAKPASGSTPALDDITDVTITGTPADNELLAYNTGTNQWINQTASEAGVITSVEDDTSPTLGGDLNTGGYTITSPTDNSILLSAAGTGDVEIASASDLRVNDTLLVDTINEDTAANGVVVDGMTIKDGLVVGGSGTGVDNSSFDTSAGEPGGDWLTWTPTIGVAGGTYTSVTINRAVYKKVGNIVFLEIDVDGTAGSTPTYYTFTPPTTPATNTLGCMTVQRLFDTGSLYEAGMCFLATTTFRVYKYDRSTFTDGAGSRFQVSGWYME